MLKLPVCPYCKTVFNYKETVKNTRKKKVECYHCKNYFTNNFLLIIIPLLSMMLLGIVIDFIILRLTGTFSKSIIPLIIVSWVMLILAVLSAPFFVKYKTIKGQKTKKIPDSSLLKDAELKRSENKKRR